MYFKIKASVTFEKFQKVSYNDANFTKTNWKVHATTSPTINIQN